MDLATSPGHPGRQNEDFVAAAPGVLVMVDGAGIPGAEHLCRHGVAWYARMLGSGMLAPAAARDTDLVTALAGAIADVAERHRHTCEIADISAPQATVAAVRVTGEYVDHLVLADAYVVLDLADGGVVVVTDPREAQARQAASALARAAAIGVLRARRNQPGGYWIAKDDPAVATEAVTGRVARSDLRGVAVLSNGAARAVHPCRLWDWPALLDHLHAGGAEGALARLRAAEGSGPAAPDDASIGYLDLDSPGLG